MRDDTPYTTRPAGERARERECMLGVLGVARGLGPVGAIYEAFGGVGDTALILSGLFPRTPILSSDLSVACVAEYQAKKIQWASIIHEDALSALRQASLTRCWGATLDFNRLTLMDLMNGGRPEGEWRVELIQAVVDRAPAWVQVTDSAVRYLHLNWQCYGCADKSFGAYAERVAAAYNERFGLQLVAHEHHHAAGYFLFKLEN